MDVQSEKFRLIEWLVGLQDISVLQKVADVKDESVDEEFTPQQKLKIDNREASDEEEKKSWLNRDQIEKLKERRTNHLNGSSKSYNWQEVKELSRK